MQASSEIWKNARKHRLTASSFAQVAKRVKEWNYAAVKNVCNETKPDISHVRAVQYGVKNEQLAATKYIKYVRSIGHSVYVEHCGIVVAPSVCWLGVSPDRKIYDESAKDKYGLMEIKCPYSYREKTPTEALNDKTFYVELLNGVPKLKRIHPYYLQIQGQMGVTGASWCDFVVYFQKGLIVERVQFDELLWQEVLEKLTNFYFKTLIKYMCINCHAPYAD